MKGTARRESRSGRVIRLLADLLTSEAERGHPEPVREGLIGTVFGRASNVLLVGFAGLGTGILAFVRAGALVPLLFGIAGFGFSMFRVVLIQRFGRRVLKLSTAALPPWIAGFGVSAIASSVCWGAQGFYCLALSGDSILYTASLVMTTATTTGLAARNAGTPRVARLQLLAIELPILAAVPFTNDEAYNVLLVIVPAFLFGLSELTADTNRQLVESFRLQMKLTIMSNIDDLTQIANRRQFSTQTALALAECRSLRQPISMLMIDVDFFKAFNDNYGHQAGDDCLRRVARILHDNLRNDGDIVSRYGGEEFAVSLKNATEADALQVAARLCDAISRSEIAHHYRGDGVEVVTVSIGVVSSDRSFEGIDQLVRAADQGLYMAKRSGRNRVAVAPVETRQGQWLPDQPLAV